MKADCIVAGGAGFLGFHLCKKLVDQGFRVLCLDNLKTGHMDNVQHLLDYLPLFRFKNCDLEYDNLNFINGAKYIFNLASPASPKDYNAFPLDTLLTNAIGTKKLLDLAVKTDAVFFQASSSEVYGDPLSSPQGENYHGNVNPFGPRACYDEGKRFAETLCYIYMNTGVDMKVGRLFNIYGTHMRLDDGRVVPNFIVNALKNEDLPIHGSGSQIRCFTYVDDAVKAIVDLTLSNHHGIFNIGRPDETRITQLANMILDLTGSKGWLKYIERPEDDPTLRVPYIKKITDAIGWKPKVGLKEGLIKIIPYYQEVIDAR